MHSERWCLLYSVPIGERFDITLKIRIQKETVQSLLGSILLQVVLTYQDTHSK